MLKFIKKTSLRLTLTILVLAVAVFGFVFKAQVIRQLKHAAAYYEVYRGDQSYKKGNLQNAITYYNKALELYPEHVKARYNLGNIYVAFEDYGSAVTCYEQALEYNPKHLNSRINLGIILSEQFSDYERAVQEYQKAIDDQPFGIKIPFVYNNLSYIRNSTEYSHYNMGLAYKGLSLSYGDDTSFSRYYLQQAAKSYKEALKIESGNYDTNYNLGLIEQLLGQNAEARKYYCKAINIAPLNYEAHYNFALLLREDKKYVESVIELEKAGLILDSKGEGYITSYIYGVLNEVTIKARGLSNYKELIEKINNNPVNSYELTYINGKVVSSDDFDKAIIKNLKYCNACDDTSEENQK